MAIRSEKVEKTLIWEATIKTVYSTSIHLCFIYVTLDYCSLNPLSFYKWLNFFSTVVEQNCQDTLLVVDAYGKERSAAVSMNFAY